MMLDPGRYLAEAIYFLQYTLAQILWAIDRATLSVAVIAEGVNAWLTDNVAYFVELLVNGLSAPLGGMFILALTALGAWYALNNVVPTARWVDPSKLISYGLVALFFFSSPVIVIEMLEEMRVALNGGVDAALLDGAEGEIFAAAMDGTDPGLPAAIPDVNGDGAAGSFDLAAAFIGVANLDELDSSEFPVDFEDAYFPFGDPSGIDLSDEADQELAKALASDGIERLFFALFAVPTAIAEHVLRLSLTGTAVFLYAGVPFAMLFAFFVYTQSLLAAYLRQFINLFIETFMSVVIAAIAIGLLAAAARQGIGLYIGAGLIACFVLLWRIKSALKLAAGAFDLLGGATLTGGAGGMEAVRMGGRAAGGAAGLAGAVLTGGASLAAGSALLAAAGAVRADGEAGGGYLGGDPEKAEGRARQLKTMAGYALGRSETARRLIESGHEARTLGRNFRDGEVEEHAPDALDYLRAGSSMSGFGSSPWLAMRLSPSLREAYDEIGGGGYGAGRPYRDEAFDGDGEPVGMARPAAAPPPARGEGTEGAAETTETTSLTPAEPDDWRTEAATARQIAYLQGMGVEIPEGLTRGAAAGLIRERQREGAAGTDTEGTDAGPGRSPALPPDLARRFHSLEQAIVALTAALGEGDVNEEVASEAGDDNGPIPAWLREDAAAGPDDNRIEGDGLPGDDVQDVRLVSVDPDVDEDGLADVAGGFPGATPPPAVPGPPDPGEGPSASALPPAPQITIAPPDETRHETFRAALAGLAGEDVAARRAAYQTLVAAAGPDNAARLQAAAQEHGAETVEQAAAATADRVAAYRESGMDDAAILAAFQSGEAGAQIRETTETPLSDAQLAAVADAVLLPGRRLSRAELAGVIGEQVAAGARDETAVSRAIGSPVGFGGQTGAVRGVMAGAREMGLTAEELARLAILIRDGLREEVTAGLTARGARPETARAFAADLAALPGAMTVPQTTAVSPDETAAAADAEPDTTTPEMTGEAE